MEGGGVSTEHRGISQSRKELLSRDWLIEIKYIFREANRTANWSTKWAARNEVGVIEWTEPPLELVRIVEEDEQGIEFPRDGVMLS